MRFVLSAVALAFAMPAQAEIIARSDSGFVVRHVAEVTAGPEDSWKALVDPAGWWNGEHTFSSDPKNLSIEPRAGGCFCEVLPGEGEKGWLQPRGGVEHMPRRFRGVEQGAAHKGRIGAALVGGSARHAHDHAEARRRHAADLGIWRGWLHRQGRAVRSRGRQRDRRAAPAASWQARPKGACV